MCDFLLDSLLSYFPEPSLVRANMTGNMRHLFYITPNCH